MSEYIDREADRDVCERPPITQAIRGGENSICWSCLHWDVCFAKENQPCIKCSRYIPAADVRPVPEGGIGEMSDGFHTFNGLYYQRMVLSAALVKQNKGKAWKSWRHEDGELCFGGGWFIVGIDTPKGCYTYHYEEKDWNRFECEELPVAKHWDGHTEKDVTRLLSLDVRPVVLCKDCRHRDPEDHKCDCGQLERAGCVFPVDDDYFCAYGEKMEKS